MALDLRDCSFFGPALPEPFVKFQLEDHLTKAKLLPKATGPDAKVLQDGWEVYRRKLRDLMGAGGAIRVANHVLEPLAGRLGYGHLEREPEVATREGSEDGGSLFTGVDGAHGLRAWAVAAGTDLDAPNRRGRAYRFSPSRVAQRVLLAKGERVGLLTDGEELRLLLCDPARPDSHIGIRLDRVGGWRAFRRVPDSYRLLLALASPAGIAALPELTEAARLVQTQVTRELRTQARQAIEGFIQALLDNPHNRGALTAFGDQAALARTLWQEGLVLVYRLLFIFKLESSADPARAFSFASTSLWRHTFSPNAALAPFVRRHLDEGHNTGALLEEGLRTLFRLFHDGLRSSEINIRPLGGMLFGEDATPLLDRLAWSERAVALLLDRLLWTAPARGRERQRVHYGPLDVEDLGRVYEALIELEAGITAEPMARLRRAKLEVVVPQAQAAPYKAAPYKAAPAPASEPANDETDDEEPDLEEDDETPRRGKKTKVQWVENISAGRFYLRVGLGRKASGSYYTPHPFVRFLVQETLGPQVAERSRTDDPKPAEILKLKVLDPAMGSGHFLVEACRYLGQALYEACRLCDEHAAEAEVKAEESTDAAERTALLAKAEALRQRVADLPDPDDELVAYLPSRAPEGEATGFSQRKAEALCRRLVAVHCLYGVDKNPLAVELAKLSLWPESYAEGLPLTFLDHRLICGDSLTGPFFEHLLTYPISGKPIEGLFAQGLTGRLQEMLAEALAEVRDLEASVGKDVADLTQKRAAKAKLDAALEPLKQLARAWSGAVMLGEPNGDAAYETLAKAVSETGATRNSERLAAAADAVSFDLTFPEVFHPDGRPKRSGGFGAVLGNPPWDALQPLAKEFFAAFDLRILDAPTRRERAAVEKRLTANPKIRSRYENFVAKFEQTKRLVARVYTRVCREANDQPSGAATDLWQVFAERGTRLLKLGGAIGWVLPSAFHANQSATGIRELYLNEIGLTCCFSFENRRKLFEIDSRFKFALVVARNDIHGKAPFQCAFYLHDADWLFGQRTAFTYGVDFVAKAGGSYFTFVELREQRDMAVADKLFGQSERLGPVLARCGIRFGEEFHMSKLSGLFTPTDRVVPAGGDPRDQVMYKQLLENGYLPLHEGKTFHQFTDCWGKPPRYLVALDNLRDKPSWLHAARFYRLALRAVARSTDERTAILCLLPPHVVFGNSAPAEKAPFARETFCALWLVALVNAFPFDWALRQKTSAKVSFFIVNDCPIPSFSEAPQRFLVHSALLLSCNHAGYAPLWAEQLGQTWRESSAPFTWPVLTDEDARWRVRAAIDAVVADAYGLNRAEYAHVLASFSHASYPDAPRLCLTVFDELKAIGLDLFVREHDPYWDIPLNQSLPKPIIDFPGLEAEADTAGKGRPTADRSGQYQLLSPDAGLLFSAASGPRKPAAAASADGGDDTYELIVLLLEEKSPITSADAQDLTGLDAAGVRPHLKRLVVEGKARTEGERRGMKYYLA